MAPQTQFLLEVDVYYLNHATHMHFEASSQTGMPSEQLYFKIFVSCLMRHFAFQAIAKQIPDMASHIPSYCSISKNQLVLKAVASYPITGTLFVLTLIWLNLLDLKFN